MFSLLCLIAFYLTDWSQQSFTIDYIKSNKWCAMEDGNLMCFEFNGNKINSTENGKPKDSIEVIFEQKSDSLIAMKALNGVGVHSSFRMKSLDTLNYFLTVEELGDEEFRLIDIVRVKN